MQPIFKNFTSGALLRALFFLSALSPALPSHGQGASHALGANTAPAVRSVFHALKPWIEHRNAHLPPEERLTCETLKGVFEAREPRLEDLNRVSQKFFLRPPAAERTDLLGRAEDDLLQQKRDALLQLFDEMGHTSAATPRRRAYDYILFNGATVAAMRGRLQTLIDYVEGGSLDLRNTKLVFLTGERDLFKSAERGEWEQKNLEDLPASGIDPQWQRPGALPKTEDQALQWIWQQTNLPPSLRAAKTVWVVAQKKRDEKGNWLRPTTSDTVETWFKQENPPSGSCLVLSSQPFVAYQQEVLHTALLERGQEGFVLEGVGRAVSQELLRTPGVIQILLDNLARFLFEKHKQQALLQAKRAKPEAGAVQKKKVRKVSF